MINVIHGGNRKGKHTDTHTHTHIYFLQTKFT